MARGGYKEPTRAEYRLRKRCNALEHRLGLYEQDASGKLVIDELEDKIAALEDEAASLKAVKAKNANLTDKNKTLNDTVNLQKKEIAALKMDVKVAYSYEIDLERKLARTERHRHEWATFARRVTVELSECRSEVRKLRAQVSRNSSNSSMPPSSSPVKKAHNSRVKTGRKPGAQAGHAGHRRRQYVPDRTVAIDPVEVCLCCGSKDLAHTKEAPRRITDLIAVLDTIEYEASSSACNSCGSIIEAPFPRDAVNEQNYGNNIRAITTLLVNRYNVSKANASDFLYELTDHKLRVSTGSIQNYLTRFAEEAKDLLEKLEEGLGSGPVIGSDATHTSTGGKQTYVYGFVNGDTALYRPSATKGITPLRGSPIDGYEGTVVHDHDRSYYHFGAFHAECNVHVMRDLKGVIENEPEKTWAPQMRELIARARELDIAAGSDNPPRTVGDEVIADITSRFNEIIALGEAEYAADMPISPKYRPEGIALGKRLKDFRDNHLLFLRDSAIPFSNNFSERALRRVKMKTKQSGGFRSEENGKAPYCGFLSVTQTASMRDMELLGTVRAVFEGKEDIFAGTKPSPAPDP